MLGIWLSLGKAAELVGARSKWKMMLLSKVEPTSELSKDLSIPINYYH